MEFNFTKREKSLALVLITLIIFAVFKFCAIHTFLYVWHHPDTNTNVLAHIFPAVKRLDYVLNTAQKNIGNDKYKISYVYKNYYGSGFLKNNPIPNDLDCSIGVYLGTFDYNGSNSDVIADFVMSKISVFYTAFYEAVQQHSDKKIFSPVNPLSFDNIHSFGNNVDRDSFAVSLPHIFKDESYVFSIPKSPLDDPTMKVNIPFVMENNEILIENLEPTVLFMQDVKYNSQMRNYPREVSVIFDFFIDVKNTQTGEIKRVEIIPESFLGERLQIARRLFVPSVFSGIESYLYLKNFDYLNNEEKYLKNRIYNLKRYVEIIQYNLEKDIMPVKILKRLHQSLDAFSPLLSQNQKDKYYSVIESYLNNPEVAYLNDIQNILSILKVVAQNERTLAFFKKSGQLSVLSKCFDSDIYALKKSGRFDKNKLNEIDVYEKNIIEKMYSTKSYKDLEDLNKYIFTNGISNGIIIKNMYMQVIDKDKLLEIDDELKKIFTASGFKKITIYWLDNQNIGVIKDDSLKGVSLQLLKDAALEANLPDINYHFINKSDIKNKIPVNSDVWLRLNRSSIYDKNFEQMKKRLLDDKKNYKIKKKFILK